MSPGREDARGHGGPARILIVDNYDSFTWNLVDLKRVPASASPRSFNNMSGIGRSVTADVEIPPGGHLANFAYHRHGARPAAISLPPGE